MEGTADEEVGEEETSELSVEAEELRLCIVSRRRSRSE
jgi:hypothetical protein